MTSTQTQGDEREGRLSFEGGPPVHQKFRSSVSSCIWWQEEIERGHRGLCDCMKAGGRARDSGHPHLGED